MEKLLHFYRDPIYYKGEIKKTAHNYGEIKKTTQTRVAHNKAKATSRVLQPKPFFNYSCLIPGLLTHEYCPSDCRGTHISTQTES